jgi:hypothetical protein
VRVVEFYGEEDADGDGLSNYDEVHLYGTDPSAADTDGDGVSDYDELFVDGTDPLVPNPINPPPRRVLALGAGGLVNTFLMEGNVVVENKIPDLFGPIAGKFIFLLKSPAVKIAVDFEGKVDMRWRRIESFIVWIFRSMA